MFFVGKRHTLHQPQGRSGIVVDIARAPKAPAVVKSVYKARGELAGVKRADSLVGLGVWEEE